MPFKIAEAFVEIKADKGKFSGTIRSAKRETDGFAKSATKSLKQIGIGLGIIATAATAAAVAIGVKLTRAITRAGKATIDAAVRYDKLKIGLKAVAGSSDEAARQLLRLEKVSKLPGLSFEGAIAGSTALQAAGLSAELSERSLLAFGNALVTVGKGADDLKGVNLALTQIVTKGTGFGQELRQLSERLPQVRKAMKDAFGIGSVEDFKKLGLSAEDFIEGIIIEFEKLPKVTGTVANALENLDIAFDRLKAEIGKTLLGITTDTAKGLTDIADKIRQIIPVWNEYQTDVAQIFRNITVIGVKSTGVLIKSMVRLTVGLAPAVWEPFLFAWKQTSLQIEDSFGRFIINLGKGFVSDKTYQEWLDRRAKSTEEHSAIIGKDFETAFDPKFAAAMTITLEELDVIFKEITGSIAQISSSFDPLIAKIPQAVVEPAKKAVAELKKIDPKELDFLKLETEDPKKAVQRLQDSIKRIADFRKGIDDEMSRRQEINLERFQGFLREQEDAAQRLADAISPIFENMFANFFQGDTKNLWEAFWNDLKRIAIRQFAGIFATQLLGGLLTGGAGFAGVGLAATLSPLAPNPSQVSRRVGGAIATGARAVGSFLEGGTINIMDQDLTNFDQQRLTKQVEQGIVPAFNKAAADGI